MSKRFYKTADTHETLGGYAVTLDGRPVKTPAGRALVLPTLALAQSVAGEWNAQGDSVDPHSMCFMRYSATAMDRAPEVRDEIVEGLLRYADTDLLCYRAAHPEDLVHRQAALWQPLLDWSADELGAHLIVSEGVVPISQAEDARAAFKVVLKALDDWTLIGLGELVGISGSLVVGLALLKGRLNPDQAFAVCHVDEDHQSALWGEDDQARQRRENVRDDLRSAARYLELLRV